MFDYFRGLVTDKKKTAKGSFVTIEVANIGYLVEIIERDFDTLDISLKESQKIYTHLSHKEDAMCLYGFLNKETRDIFQILISVSGVGAKMAIALLNEFDACNLISLVINADYKELTRAKGVGPKLAQKIIIELKDKLIKTELPKVACSIPQSQALNETQTILLSLGYNEKEIEDALTKIAPTIEEDSNAEDIIRKALTNLSM